MFFLISGEDTFRSTQRLAHLRERFCGLRDTSGLNVVNLESRQDGVTPLLEAMLTVPFLAEKKLVIARGYLAAGEEDQRQISGALERLPETTHMIFFEEASAADLAKASLYPLLAKQKHSETFAPVAASEVGGLFAEEVKANGIKLTPEAERLAVTALAADSWQIVQEAQKLAAWCAANGQDTADVAAVEAILCGSREEPAFAFIDACMNGQTKRAVVLLADLFAAGQNEFQVLGAVTRQIRTFVAVRDLLDRGVRDKNAVAKELKMHPYPAEKTMRACERFDAQLLRRLYEAALETDMDLKTGRADRSAVELLAVRLASVRKR